MTAPVRLSPCERAVIFQIDEIEELAGLLTIYCDLDPDPSPEIQTIRAKLIAALVPDVRSDIDHVH